MTDLYPSVEPVLESARLYLTGKLPDPAHLADFRARLAALCVSPEEIERSCREWAAELGNAGKASSVEAAKAAEVRAQYAAGHAARMRAFVAGFLARPDYPQDRVAALRAQMKES